MYITYEEFCAISDEGIILSEEQFKRYELKARVKLDYYTQNRLENLETIPEKIKYLMYELITIIYSEDENKKDKGIVQSVSNDGYSVTYENVNPNEENESLEVKLHSLITEYATEYCYRGVEK